MTPDEIEAERRAAAYDAWEKQRAQEELEIMPLSKEHLKALFDLLMASSTPPCNHTYKQTNKFLKSHKLDPKSIIPWLRRNGGYCDCEIVYNVEYKFRDLIA